MNMSEIVVKSSVKKPSKTSEAVTKPSLTNSINKYLNEKSVSFTTGLVCGALERSTGVEYFTMVPALILGSKCTSFESSDMGNLLCYAAGLNVAYIDKIYDMAKNINL